MTIAIISHPDCLLHTATEGHPECPERVKVIQEALTHYPFKVPVKFLEAPMANKEYLMPAHDKRYLDWVISNVPKEGLIQIDMDTYMNPYTLNAALRAVGAVILAVDSVMRHEAQAVFCNIRPPGHHAEREQAMGFCFFNNVAIGALYALEKYHLERIVIVDFDVHHGNGTQNIFQQNKQVMYCSSFQYPFYPGYDEEMDSDHILSVPLEAATRGDVFRQRVQAAWFDKIAAFRPQLIFFSAGFDAHKNDPLAELGLTKEDYVWLTEQIAKIAKVHCEGKMISVLEGGYNLEVLAECVPAHVEAMVI